MELSVERFGPSLLDDFLALHGAGDGSGWCFCVAWWVPSWEGWGERSAQENLALRRSLCEAGHFDGYLLYLDGRPVGWCQVGPRDRLPKLRSQFGLQPDPDAWAVTCFLIEAGCRRQGLAGHLLGAVLADLGRRGARRVEAFPKCTASQDPGELWTGPRELFLRAGFRDAREDSQRPVLSLELPE